MLARWHTCPTLLPSPPKRPAKASDEAGRRVGGDKALSSVLDTEMLSAAEYHTERLGSQPGKRQKCAVDTMAGRADHQMVHVDRIPLSPVR